VIGLVFQHTDVPRGDGLIPVRSYFDLKKGSYYIVRYNGTYYTGIVESIDEYDEKIGYHHLIRRMDKTELKITFDGFNECRIYTCTLH